MSYVTSVRTRGKTQSVKIRREKTLHKSCNVVYRSVSMAAHSAQRSTALATDCAQPSSAATPRSRRVNSAQQLFSDAPHSPRIRDSPSLVTQSAQRSATSTPRSRRDFSARRCNSFSSQLSIPTTPCSIAIIERV